jgi:hypothetical protein
MARTSAGLAKFRCIGEKLHPMAAGLSPAGVVLWDMLQLVQASIIIGLHSECFGSLTEPRREGAPFLAVRRAMLSAQKGDEDYALA